jgi:uncharacterized protein YuzE
MGEDKIKVRYDEEGDILYILAKEGPIKDTIEVGNDLFIEVDESGEIAGIEVWQARSNVFGELFKYMDRLKKAVTKS